MGFKFYSQLESVDCGPSCLKMIAYFYKKDYTLRELKAVCGVTRLGITLKDIITGANTIGFETAGVKVNLPELQQAPLPLILFWRQEHYVVLYKINISDKGTEYFIADPAFGKIRLKESDFKKEWINNEIKGAALVIQPRPDFDSYHPNDKSGDNYFSNLLLYIKGAVGQYKGKYLGVLALFIMAMLTNWITPFLFQKIIDAGILPKKINVVWYILCAQFFLFIGNIISDYGSSILLLNINFRVGIKILSEFLHKLTRLPIGFFDVRLNTDLIQRIDDQDKIQQFLTYRLINFVFALCNMIAFSCIVLFYNPTVFTLFFMSTLGAVVWTFFFLNKRKILDYSRFSSLSENKNNIYELIMGMAEIKINNAQHSKLDKWEAIQEKLNKIVLKSLHLNYYQLFGVNFFNKIKDILVTGLCAFLVIHDQMSLGVMMSISYILGQLKTPTDQIIEFTRTSQDAKLAYDRIDEIHQKSDEQTEVSNDIGKEPLKGIKLSHVLFKYEGSFNPIIFNDLSLNICKGQITAIVGTSGSGKTTLLKLLLGFYSPLGGNILINNVDMSTIDINNWRDRCGIVMQDGFIYSGTVAENIALATETPNQEKLINAIHIACLTEFVEALPLGLNTKIGRSGIDLSGGQKQRLLIARAVYKNPEFIIFDEATSSLDANNERKIMNNLDTFFKGKTVVIIAHRLSTVKNANQIIVLEKGQIVESGPHHLLVEKQSHYFNLVKNQLELGS